MTNAYLLELATSKSWGNEKHGIAYDLMELYLRFPWKENFQEQPLKYIETTSDC
jgi:hypothetical protein